MGYTQSCLEELRSRIDLAQFLESYLDFKRTGSQLKALCPFHQENSPSFMVKRGDRHYHCFGCGAHGDAISFLVQHQGMRFPDAVELLAERYGVDLENEQNPQERDARKRAFFVMERASLFYQEQLQTSSQAKKYLLGRAMPPERWGSYALGYAPKSGFALKKALNSQKISDDEMLTLGLLRGAEGARPRDFFTHRLVFPVLDAMGRTVAFSARAIDDDYFGGKYINSPETLLFKKSRTLYGLPYSRQAIAKQRRLLLVEGQFDTISLIESGLNFTVCALGTAFGADHAFEIKRLGVQKVYIVFDSDVAGQKASIKAGLALHRLGVDVLVTSLPQGMDPDQFIAEQGAKAVIDQLNHSLPFLEFWVKKEAALVNLGSPAAKIALSRDIAQSLESIDDTLLRHESLLHLTQLLQLPAEAAASLTSSKGVRKEKKEAAGDASQIQRKKSDHSTRENTAAFRSATYDGLEADFLRWLFQPSNDQTAFWQIALQYGGEEFLEHKGLKWLYLWLKDKREPDTVLPGVSDLMVALPSEKSRQFLSNLLAKRMDHERARELFTKTLSDLIRRRWRWKLQEIREKLSSAQMDEESALQVAHEYAQQIQSEPESLQCSVLFP